MILHLISYFNECTALFLGKMVMLVCKIAYRKIEKNSWKCEVWAFCVFYWNSFFQYNVIISTSKFPCNYPLVMRYYNFFSIFFFRLWKLSFYSILLIDYFVHILYLSNTYKLHGSWIGVQVGDVNIMTILIFFYVQMCMPISALSPRCHTTLQDVWDNLNSSPSGILDGLVRLHYHIIAWQPINNILNRPRSAVGNVSGCRYVSNCRSRGCEFDPGQAHTFMEIYHEIISTFILLPLI